MVSDSAYLLTCPNTKPCPTTENDVLCHTIQGKCMGEPLYWGRPPLSSTKCLLSLKMTRTFVNRWARFYGASDDAQHSSKQPTTQTLGTARAFRGPGNAPTSSFRVPTVFHLLFITPKPLRPIKKQELCLYLDFLYPDCFVPRTKFPTLHILVIASWIEGNYLHIRCPLCGLQIYQRVRTSQHDLCLSPG